MLSYVLLRGRELKGSYSGTSLVVHWFRPVLLMQGLGTKIPHATGYGQGGKIVWLKENSLK